MKHLIALFIFAAFASTAPAQVTNRFASTIFKVLTNDFSITNQTNMTVVNDLTVSVQPNTSYVFQLFPILFSTQINSFTVQIIASNATVYGNWNRDATGFATTNALTNETLLGGTAQRSIVQFFYVRGGTNAGTIGVQFRSTFTNNINQFSAGSFIRADKMPQ